MITINSNETIWHSSLYDFDDNYNHFGASSDYDWERL